MAKRKLPVTNDDATYTLKNRLNPISPELFSERQKTRGRPVVSARFEHKYDGVSLGKQIILWLFRLYIFYDSTNLFIC